MLENLLVIIQEANIAERLNKCRVSLRINQPKN